VEKTQDFREKAVNLEAARADHPPPTRKGLALWCFGSHQEMLLETANPTKVGDAKP
jgi:hypothetical protein